jgi:hypothetical protein
MQLNRIAGLFGSFVVATVATFAVTANEYLDLSHPTRITMALLAVVLIHCLRYLRLWLSREVLLNLGFLGYALLSLLWTTHIKYAMFTVPALVNFTLTLIIFSAFAALYDPRALLAGILAGFLAAAAYYSLKTGYPLHYPDDFSYNSIAVMYLFGFFATLVFGAYFRMTVLPLALAVILLALIASTTSIKTNLGVILGIAGSGILYFRFSMKHALRNFVIVALLASAVIYGVMSNQELTDRVEHGFERVSRGFAVLTNREGDSGGIGLGTRQGWKNEGLKGWYSNPVFGYGVEAFRADFGITSHSTPIDLLYNSGLIGFGLFYSMLASIAWRLLRARDRNTRSVRARVTTILIAYGFISISGLVYYAPLLAIFVAVSSGLIMRLEQAADRGLIREEQLAGDAGAFVATA